MEIDEATDPFLFFEAWFAEAAAAEPSDPNAMALATVGPAGTPSVRTVLLKEYDRRGFVFYTNLESRKGLELGENPKAGLCFHWKSLRRQVRIDGVVGPVSEAEADAYFASRPRDSRIGAWASLQSRPLDRRATLELRVAEFEQRFPVAVPRPPHWSGYRVAPLRIEFWQERPFRLHDRLLFSAAGEAWDSMRLYP